MSILSNIKLLDVKPRNLLFAKVFQVIEVKPRFGDKKPRLVEVEPRPAEVKPN